MCEISETAEPRLPIFVDYDIFLKINKERWSIFSSGNWSKRAFFFMLAFTWVLFFVNIQTGIAQFQQTTGPQGGVVEAIINHNGTLFAGSLGSGVFRSTDGGNSWISANTGLQNFLIHAFAEFDSVVYVGTSNGIYKSTDDGVTWIFSGLNSDVISIARCGNYLFAGSSFAGLFRSDLNGNNWIQKNSGLSNLDVTAIVPYDSIIYIGTQRGVYIQPHGETVGRTPACLILFGH